jgi:hypothetical protein
MEADHPQNASELFAGTASAISRIMVRRGLSSDSREVSALLGAEDMRENREGQTQGDKSSPRHGYAFLEA